MPKEMDLFIDPPLNPGLTTWEDTNSMTKWSITYTMTHYKNS